MSSQFITFNLAYAGLLGGFAYAARCAGATLHAVAHTLASAFLLSNALWALIRFQ